MSTINDSLAVQKALALKAIPEPYRRLPDYDTVFSGPEAVFEHLNA